MVGRARVEILEPPQSESGRGEGGLPDATPGERVDDPGRQEHGRRREPALRDVELDERRPREQESERRRREPVKIVRSTVVGELERNLEMDQALELGDSL